MDLLIQVTTAHKVSPGGHVIHVVSDNRLLSYKPSTPIGTLDTSIIQIVAKNRMNEEAKKRRAHLVTQAIEKNVRLKPKEYVYKQQLVVNLPRNQLAVYRVPAKTLISDVLAMVCKDRCFDLENHEIRHPVNVDEKLRGSCTLADYQLQEVSVVPKDFRAPPLSVTDLITMAAISSSSSHTEDKKRRGILSLFSRKTKSSAGESSLSSGSAGERSVSPARSDESTDGRPTSRPLSPASSSATLTNSTHVQGPPAPPPPLSRPPSALNLAGKSRKRQAPAPPPVHPPQQGSYNEGKAAADFKNERHSNGKTSESAVFETRCKTQSSDASGFGEYDDQSPYASPSGSEVSSVEATRLPQSSHPTNLTSVTSTSSLSLVSRSKRRAPPPPKPPPTARTEDLPSAIPEEESESPAPAEDDDARAEVAGQDVVRSPSPASSHVSSVSSLSSVEHQAASTPLKPPLSPQTPPEEEEEEEEEEETTPPSTPPPPPSDSYVSGAALVGAMPRNPPPPLAVEQTEPSFVITYTPTTTEHSLANALSAGTSTPADPIPTPAHSLNPAASQNPSGMMHEDAAGSVGVTNYTRLDTSEASGLVSSDRLAEESRPLPPRQLHHQNASTSQEKTRPGVPHRAASIENGSQRRGAADNPRKVNSVGYSSVGDGDVRNQWNASAKRDSVDIRDAITPLQSNMGSIPAIPTFRIVTKSHTAVQKDDDTSRKFVADGKTQKFSDGDKFGSKSKGLGNPLSRGRLIHQDDVDFDDDLDINEDMFEPRQLFGLSSSSVNLSGNSNLSATENGHEAAVSSTPVGGSLPQPVPRRLAPNAEGSGGVPVPVPRNQLNRRQAPVPPKMEEKRETQVNDRESIDIKLDHKGSVDVPRESVISEAEQFEKLMQQGPDEEFKVHVSSVANLDPDMLSLLSEECVDEGRPKSLSLNSSSASETSDASREVSEAFGRRVGVSPGETSSRATLRPPSPPTKTIEAQTTASSYRAGYLSMIAQMADWDDPVSYDTDSDDENQKDSSPPNLPAHRPGQYPTSAAVAARGSDQGGNDFISPLCSDTDHEVQTRSACFSSETSEESSDSSNRKRDVPRRNNEGDVEGSKSGSSSPSTRSVTSSSSGRSTESSGDSDNGKEDRVGAKKQEVERASSKSSSTASSISSSSSSESSEDEDDEEAERPVAGKPLSAEATVKLGNTPDKEEAMVLVEVLQKEQKHDQARRGGDSGPEKRSRRDLTSSESSEDSEGDVDGDKDRDDVRDPRITANSPLSSVRIPGANEISNKSRDEKLAILANEKHAQSATRKSRSCSSSSSASSVLSSSSSSSSMKGETRRVAPSERISKDTIETHLEAAFAEVSPRDVTGERIILDLPLGPQESSDWEYKIPDPPTPFKDVPPSRVRDEESSTTSSEPLPEVLSDVPSGFKDSPGSSIPEAKNMEIIEKIESDTETKLALGVDTSDSVSVLSSSRKSSLSSHSSSYMSDEKAKQNVIEELKTVVSSEPRIVELRPKVRHVEMIMSVPKEDAASDDNAELRVEVPPAKLNYPMEQSFVPRVVAKRPAKNEEVNRKAVVGRRLKESTSSYESAFGNDSHDEVDISGRSRSRSGSSTSYESAPPPVPEIPPPLDSESDGRRGRSSSSTSESSNASGRRSAHRASDTGTTASLSRASDTNTDSSLSRAPVMSFSISTYKSRAEETSYDKKLGKSESFNHPSRPKRSTLSKTDSFAAYRDQPEPPSFVDELLEESERPPPIPEKASAPSNPAVVSKILGLREKSRSQQHIPTFERSSGAFGKPLVPPNKPSVQRFGNAGVDSHFAYPEPARPPRRLQRADSQERLGRATSLSNLATPNFELRKAQSSSELSCGSVPPNPIAASNAAEMPGFPGMMGMPMMMTGGGGPGGMMPNDSRLAEEFVKLQQDFFKWQQQLLQNQHVLHSRVAPLASNPPQLQSVGVMRDIMSQEAPAEVPPPVRSGPVERIIPIKMEMTTTSTSSSSSTNFGGNELRPSAAPGRLSQSMQDITISDAGQPGLSSSRLVSQQMPSQRRWPNEPNVSVGAWNERPSQPVGVYRDQDYVTSSPKSRSTQDLSSAGPVGPGTHYQQRPAPAAYQPPAPAAYQPPAPAAYQPPAPAAYQPPTPAAYQPAQTDAQAPQQFAQPQVPQPQAPVHAQQFQALPPQQQKQFAQFLQQQQQRQEPDRATFWRDFDAKKGSADEADSARPQYRNSYQEPVSSQDEPSKPLTYFGQDVQVQDPPMTYYYNGDGAAKPAGSSFVSSRPKAAETEAAGPRYTSVVTVSPDKEVSPGGEAVTKDKVKSVVQLNNDPPRNVPRQVAPVVRGFRQPGEDKAGAQGSTFHSKIINSASKAQPQPTSNATSSSSSVAPARGPSPPQSVPIPDAPTAARLVAAVSQPAPRGPSPAPALSSSTRVSPPKMGPSQGAPSRTSPSPRSSPSSGPAFAGVQLKPVPAALRASPPSDVFSPPPAPVLPPAPPAASQSGGAPPPPPPPAPPMAPPPPPPMAGAPERRTASGKRIVSAKTGPELDAREELMVAIKNHGGLSGLRRTGNYAFSNESS
ncbi:LOW QUALITY PROTEIN: serine-rich adhesin for platelets-like [Palaemon carinicauda]|uniref:LOW QUALITY PROTEIN: serine-rich adhesin for platelets-like n=1 Tax=Palaemon carinicauda TaxID=392227 RepID=UPI0035B645F4